VPETLTRCAGAIVDDAGCAWFVTRSRTDAIVERFRQDGTSVCAALVPFASLAPNKTAGVSSVSLDVTSSLAFVAVQARLVAIHVGNCSVFWNVTVPDFELGNKTCASPTVAEGAVYLAGTSRLHAFAVLTGKHLWQTLVIGGEEADSLAPFSPAYCDRTVIIGSMSGLPNATRLWAFDTVTGGVVWNYTQDGKGDTWSNVMLDKDCKKVLVRARNNVVVLDRRLGSLLGVAGSESMTVAALLTVGNELSFVSVTPYVRAHLATRQRISLTNVTANGARKIILLPQPPGSISFPVFGPTISADGTIFVCFNHTLITIVDLFLVELDFPAQCDCSYLTIGVEQMIYIGACLFRVTEVVAPTTTTTTTTATTTATTTTTTTTTTMTTTTTTAAATTTTTPATTTTSTMEVLTMPPVSFSSMTADASEWASSSFFTYSVASSPMETTSETERPVVDVGTIAAGVCGGIAALALFALAVTCACKRTKVQHAEVPIDEIAADVSDVVDVAVVNSIRTAVNAAVNSAASTDYSSADNNVFVEPTATMPSAEDDAVRQSDYSAQDDAVFSEPQSSAYSAQDDAVFVEPAAQTARAWVVRAADLQLGPVVGEGGFGVVRSGKWRGRTVAVKQIKRKAFNNEKALAEFEAEVKRMSTLQPHENVVQLYGVADLADGDIAAVMEWCASGALVTLLYGPKKQAALPNEQLLQWVFDACCGIMHLHANGIVHRDIAARNVLLAGTREITAKVSDFGMSRSLDADADALSGLEMVTHNKVGPVAWMAPEQLSRGAYSKASDVFSVGVLLFEVYAKNPPWRGVPLIQIAMEVTRGARVELPQSAPHAVRDLAAQCFKAIPHERPLIEDVCLVLEAENARRQTTEEKS
jgi:tRNA A-37 threonylcarbamoyl transferase component Bud32